MRGSRRGYHVDLPGDRLLYCSKGLKMENSVKTVYCTIQEKEYPVRIVHSEGKDWFCGEDFMNLVNTSIGHKHHNQIERDVKPQNRRTMSSLGIDTAGAFGGCVGSPDFYFLNELGVYQLLVQRRRRGKAANVCSWFAKLVDELNRNE